MHCPELKVEALSYQQQEKKILRDISFTLKPGALLKVHGENGAGKSTLLRLIAGLSLPTQGSISWDGHSIHALKDAYREVMHYVGHQNGIKLGLTVIENLKAFAELAQYDFLYDRKILEDWNLEKYKNYIAEKLSAGLKRRIALVRLQLFFKPLWILDEPFTALDIKTQKLLTENLTKHLHLGGSAIISSHQQITLCNINTQTLNLSPC